MYRKQIAQKASPSLRSIPTNKEIAPSPSYGSLSSVVQRVQQDPNSVSEDERQQLESAIGSRSMREILAAKQTSWVPQFQGISAQLWGDAGPVGAPIQAKGNNDVGVSEVQPENQTGLPNELKAGVENLSGMAMDDVRVHYNSSKPAELQALAYTQGTNIHVAPGQEKHLPHEAWHVVQQMQGRVKPTIQTKGVGINDDQGLEREADVMGERANLVGTRSGQNKKVNRPGLFENNLNPTLFPVRQAAHIESSIIQCQKGPIDKRDGLKRKQIKELCKEGETTKFDSRGHGLSRHGGKITDQDKATRRKIHLDTSFDTDSLLFKTVDKAINKNIGIINGWLGSKTDQNLVIEVDMSDDLPTGVKTLGSGMERIPGIGPGHLKKDEFTNATVILRKVLPERITKSMNLAAVTEWHLLTAFPSE